MAVVIDLPKERLNKIKLADWLETNTLLDQDRSSSIEDLFSQLKLEHSRDQEPRMEALRADVSSELIGREQRIGDAYPFSFNGKLLRTKNGSIPQGQWAYLFCLLISYVGLEAGAKKLDIWNMQKTTTLFEKICNLAAKNFLSGKKSEAQSLQFGAPRTSWEIEYQPFKKALEFLRATINEGTVKGSPTAHRRKDAGLDIIAWRGFPDNRTNKLFLLGQCAAGTDFKKKKRDIQDFKQYYSLDVTVLYSFFIPHEVDENDWSYFYYPEVGILFDRSRIAFYAQEWDGDGFKERMIAILETLKKYGKAL